MFFHYLSTGNNKRSRVIFYYPEPWMVVLEQGRGYCYQVSIKVTTYNSVKYLRKLHARLVLTD